MRELGAFLPWHDDCCFSQLAMSSHDVPERNAPLKREVARPPAHDRVFVQLLILSTLPMLAGMASLWIGVFLGAGPGQPGSTGAPSPALPSEAAQRAVAPTSTALEPGFAFVFELASTPYLHLQDMDAVVLDEGTGDGALADDLGDEDAEILDQVRPPRAPLPAHAQPALVRMDGMPVAAVAAVRARDLPASLAAWQDRDVLVDGACRARVTGFALVARVFAEELAFEEQEQKLPEAAVARAIFDDLGHLVLAARLDGCEGSYAQPASQPGDRPVAIRATLLDGHPAVAEAVRALRRSEPGRAAQRTWRENDYEGAWWRDAQVTTQVLQHPRTGETFVSVHALADAECGGLEINLWGMYRVRGETTLEPIAQRALDNVYALQRFVDIDGDGRFEMLASSLWGMDTFLLGADGSRMAMLHLPFFGCQC